MQTIENDIKNKAFHQIYLLYGEETYLKRAYKNKLKNSIIRSDDTMNYHYFEGKNIDIKEVIALAETMPFFSDYRLIFLENSGFFKTPCEELASYLKEMSSSTILVFIENEVDKRGKLFKTVKQYGYPCEFIKQHETRIVPWILAILKKEGKKITQPTMQLFLSKTGTDMEIIEKELEKLICYTIDQEVITENDVETICTGQTTSKIFDMINAISEKRQQHALELYYDLLLLEEPPMRILFLLSKQFNLLMQIKELSASHHDKTSIARKTGLQSFLIGKYITQSNHFSSNILKQYVTKCIETEESIKTGQLNDRLGVELLIITFSQ